MVLLAGLTAVSPAVAQTLVRADASSNAGLLSFASTINGVVTASPNTGGGATGGPSGTGATSAFAETFQTGLAGTVPIRDDGYASVDLRTGHLRGLVANTPGNYFGSPSGLAYSRFEERVVFTNSAAVPVSLPLSWNVGGIVTPNTTGPIGSHVIRATIQLNESGYVFSVPMPTLQGTAGGTQNLFFENSNGARTFRNTLSGATFNFGASPVWTIAEAGTAGASMTSNILVPPGVSEMQVVAILEVDCRGGVSCDFRNNSGAFFRLGVLPQGLTMTSNSGVFLDATGIFPQTPGAPTNFLARANGSTLHLSWGAPATGGAPTSYTLIARGTPGGPLLATVPLGNVTSLVTPAPNGTFVLSLQASNALGTGPESAPSSVTVPSVPAAPGAPTNLTVATAGSTATFTWGAPSSGGPVGNYALVAGTSPGFTVPLATLPLSGAATSTAIPGIPPGTYYVRIVAQNLGGTSASSNEVAVVVAAPAAPGAPTLNVPAVAGNTVALSWTPGSGGTPVSYELTALTPGGVVLARVPLSGTTVSFSGVPSGSYQLRLVAINGVGSSPASATVPLVVP